MKRLALPLCLVAVVALTVAGGIAFAAKEIPSILDTDFSGFDLAKVSLKGAGKLTGAGGASLSIDDLGNFTYTSVTGVSFTGTITQDRKKLFVTLGPGELGNIEDQLGNAIEEALAFQGIDAGDVSVTIDPAKLKLKAKLKVKKDEITIKLLISGPYTGISSMFGPGKGKAKQKAIVTVPLGG